MSAIKNSGVAAFVAALAVSIAACGTSTERQFVHSETISKSTFKGTWPFIPDSGVLACDSSKGNAVTFTPTGSNTTYAENGSAMGWAAQEGWEPNDRHIWLTADGGQDDTPNVPRVYGGDVTQEGLRLCRDATSATATASVASSGALAAPSVASSGALAPSAQKDDLDTKFLSDIDGIGVSESPAELIASARTMCTQYSNGASENQVNQSVIAAHPDWSEGQLVRFIVDAVSDYCPQYAPNGGR